MAELLLSRESVEKISGKEIQKCLRKVTIARVGYLVEQLDWALLIGYILERSSAAVRQLVSQHRGATLNGCRCRIPP